MFILYLPRHHENPLLARFLHAQKELVQRVFKGSFEELLDSIYADGIVRMYILAARSFEDGGWLDEARAALSLAEQARPA